ncbi:type II toxin-antitoxin system tRNA(fMet)-specific endonuclease VapC [Candidatus Thiosymbion oneisti]|uniref:type II toxin-antitoxin system tRNA(fMet)-specific endonuclease VapC n=1 Tax=Candidatus Thiosymbion oneisti TaxID=589554 RepID=UPI000B260CD5|nr:type II toxin-antitoxin system VapC family toxin [Candidatus Thiosymbion oneisti]
MKILLDTDICIYVINRKRPAALARIRDYRIGAVGISSITYAELRFGVENSGRVQENLTRLERFLLPLEIVPFDAEVARQYGQLRTELKRAGCPIGSNDLLIAAHALSLDVTLVTNSVREFSRISGLRVERWG